MAVLGKLYSYAIYLFRYGNDMVCHDVMPSSCRFCRDVVTEQGPSRHNRQPCMQEEEVKVGAILLDARGGEARGVNDVNCGRNKSEGG